VGGGIAVDDAILGKMVTGPSGRHLGRVVNAEEQRFSVDVEGQFRWLPRDVIFSIDESSVTVIFEPPAVDKYTIGSGAGNSSSERAG
jgi:hypothetical protein